MKKTFILFALALLSACTAPTVEHQFSNVYDECLRYINAVEDIQRTCRVSQEYVYATYDANLRKCDQYTMFNILGMSVDECIDSFQWTPCDQLTEVKFRCNAFD